MTKLVLRRPVSAALLILAVVVFGIASITGFNMELLPDIEVPMLSVIIVYPGASATSVEEFVVMEMETACAGLSGLDGYVAYSYENYCVVTYSYAYGIDIDEAYTELTKALDRANLPDEAEDPIIMEFGFGDMPIISIAAQSDDTARLLSLVNKSIEPALKSLEGVARVEVSGGKKNYVRVQLREQAMQQYGLSIAAVAQFVGATDFNVPAGSFALGSRDISVTASSALHSLHDLRNVALLTATGSQITLSDIADISISQSDADSISHYNGGQSITIDITKAKSANSVTVSNAVVAEMERFGAGHSDMQFHIINNAGDTIIDVLLSVGQTLLIGAVLAMVIIFIFFGDFKASLIVGSSMPVSVLLTFCFMRLMGYTLHLMTGSALIIAIGMIVDNSIVVIENSFQHKANGLSYPEAAHHGASTVLASIVASTITTCVVYIPLSVMQGLAGQFLAEFGFTIIFTMVSSLISAITVIPLLFNKIRPKEKQNLPINRLLKRVTDGYRKLLPKLLKRNSIAVLIALALLLGSIGLALTFQIDIIPPMYDGSITVEAAFRSGTTLEIMESEVRVVEEALLSDPFFKTVNMVISGNTATFTAYSREDNERDSMQAVQQYTEELQSTANMDITILATGGNSSSLAFFVEPYVEINIQGYTLEHLLAFSEEVKAQIEQLPGVLKVNSLARESSTQANVVVDPKKAMHVGLTPAQVAMDIYYTLSGIEVMTATLNEEEYAIKITYPEGAYTNETALLNKPLTTGFGTLTTLGDIATVTYDEILQTRVRTDGKYQLSLTVIPVPSEREAVVSNVQSMLDTLTLPYGISFARSTNDEIIEEEISALAVAILFGVFLVFLVMAIQFESPRFSFMVMVSIPFSLIGSVLLMYLTGTSISLISMLGLLTLVGTVVNNGILFVDTANQLKQEMPVREALVESGVIRLRPILMTTLTTIIAMIPMAFEKNGNAGMMSGLAIVIIGGLATSTLLILLFIPNFYLLIAGKKADILGLDADEKERILELSD